MYMVVKSFLQSTTLLTHFLLCYVFLGTPSAHAESREDVGVSEHLLGRRRISQSPVKLVFRLKTSSKCVIFCTPTKSS